MGTNEELMVQAIEVCKTGMAAGESPFGALIARGNGEVIVAVHNTVRADCDPTSHAEINAIRRACRQLGTIDLSGHVLVTTCEPCPMCAAAAHWAKLDAVVYGATINDAVAAGFNELRLPCSSLFQQGESPTNIYPGVLQDECRGLFALWLQSANPQPY